MTRERIDINIIRTHDLVKALRQTEDELKVYATFGNLRYEIHGVYEVIDDNGEWSVEIELNEMV